MKELLLIDKDREHQKRCKSFLEKKYKVNIAESAVEAFEIADEKNIDLIISEVGIEIVDGLQIFEIVKVKYPSIKFIMYTHEEDIAVELRAIDSGIDQYLHKNVPIQILEKWVEALLRNFTPVMQKETFIAKEGLHIDHENQKTYKNGKHVKISQKEFELLAYLIQNRNVILKREEIIETVWRGRTFERSNRVVDSCIKCIRRKLDLKSIRTISGVGYEWAEVEA